MDKTHLTTNFNTKLNFDYNFSLDHNYKDFNYNEFGANINLNPIKFDFSYLQEDKHIGEQEYFKTKVDYNTSGNGLVSLETKRIYSTLCKILNPT